MKGYSLSPVRPLPRLGTGAATDTLPGAPVPGCSPEGPRSAAGQSAAFRTVSNSAGVNSMGFAFMLLAFRAWSTTSGTSDSRIP